MYDLNGDGCISRTELSEIVQAIHELLGRRPHQPEDDRKCRDQVSFQAKQHLVVRNEFKKMRKKKLSITGRQGIS